MEKRRTNLLLYTLIVIIPTVLASIAYYHQTEKKEAENKQRLAANLGRTHQQYLETLINETEKSLEVLSIVVSESLDNTAAINNILLQTKKTDKRYGNLYLIDSGGSILSAAVNNTVEKKRLPDGYINSCTNYKKTFVANQVSDSDKPYPSLYICMPLTEADNGFLLAQMRLDYIRNVLEALTPDLAIRITDYDNNEILSINKDVTAGKFDTEMTFADVPWKLHVYSADSSQIDTLYSLLKFLVLILFLTHILFLLVQYIKLKKEAAIQRKEYNNQKLHIVGTLAATTAHEIKNPLTGIKGLVQLLSEKHTDPKDQMYFSIINKEIMRINDIVNEFLVLGKPSASPMERADIRSIMEEIAPLLQREAAARLIEFHYCLGGTEELYVLCIKDQIKQVILNIVKNSFEACQSGNNISLTLHTEDTNVVMVISDDGIGMPKNELKKIFNPFFTTKQYGTGLGLYICKKILSMHKGTIRIESRQDEGTTVKITLPLHDTKTV